MPICIWVDCDEVLSETINELLKRSPLKDKWIQRSDILSYDLFEIEKIWLTKEETINAFHWFSTHLNTCKCRLCLERMKNYMNESRNDINYL